MVDGDQLGIAALIARLDDSDRIVDNTTGLVSPLDARQAITDAIRTLQNIRQYQAVCYYDDGTRDVLEFTDGTAAAGRASSLRTWLATLAAGGDGMTIYIPPGQYLVDASPIEFDQTDVRVFAYGAVFKRDSEIDSQSVVLLDGSGTCEVRGLKIDGNRANNVSAAATAQCNNAFASNYDKLTLVDFVSVDTRVDTLHTGSTRGIQIESTVGHTVLAGCYFENCSYSAIRNRAPIQEYYNVDGRITEPNTLAADKNAYTFSGTTLTATDGAHGLIVDDRVLFLSSTTLPTGVDNQTLYFVKTVPTGDTLTIALTSGGAAISLSAGAGTHYVYKYTPGVDPDRFLSTDGGSIKSLKWYGGSWSSDLPIGLGGTVTPDDTDEDVVMVCSDDSPDALFTSTPDHGYSVGDQVYIYAGTSIPGGFAEEDHYYVTEVPTAKTLKLSYLPNAPNIAYVNAGVGTINVKQTYKANNVLFDGLTIDCPHRTPVVGVIEAFIKCDNIQNITLRNVTAMFAGHHVDQTALLSVEGGGNGRRIRVLIENCLCQHGGFKHLSGEIESLVINHCEFGNERMTSGGVLDNILTKHAEVNNSILRLAGTSNFVDFSGSWDSTYELFFNNCLFVGREANPRTILSDTLARGGFYNCEKLNLAWTTAGTGIHFNNTSERRLQNNLAGPNDPMRLLWTSGTTGTGTYSENHPAEGFSSLTGLPGQEIVSDDAGAGTNDIWIWDDTNSQWDGH